MDRPSSLDSIDHIVSQTDEDEVLGPEHADVKRPVAHVRLNSKSEVTRRLQDRLGELSDMPALEMGRPQKEGSSVGLQWTASDPDDEAGVDLFYDTHREG